MQVLNTMLSCSRVIKWHLTEWIYILECVYFFTPGRLSLGIFYLFIFCGYVKVSDPTVTYSK